MMKRLLSTMLTLAALLTTLQASAAMYILGDHPLGSWLLNDAVQMTDNGDGTYTHTTALYGNVYFVFADGIADDWDTFSNNYRYGPTTSGEGETVNIGEWVTTQKSPTEAYNFRADGAEYTITFDKNNLRFKIESPAVSNFQSGGIYYNVTGPNTVEVTKGSTYGDDYSGDVTIPSSVTYGGVTYTVTAIGANAFLSCYDLTSVNIPATVTTIGETAFYYCTSLTRVVIPESVRTIEDWNFYKSDELTTVILPSTLVNMGHDCFGTCPKLSKVTCRASTPPEIGLTCFAYPYSSRPTLYVPEGSVSVYQANNNWSQYFNSVTAMPEYDFTYNNLKFVITSTNTAMCTGPLISSPSGSWSIPATAPFEGVTYRITEVGQEAFYFCDKITSFELGSNIETIGIYAFYGCYGLKTLSLGNVKTISDCAFGDCHSLTSVTIPSSVTSIGQYGFGGCGLTSITIPASVLQISNGAFYNCTSLASINVSSSNPNYTSSGGVMFSKDMKALKAYPIGNSATSYSVPEGVTSIQYGAFGYSVNLQSVTLPSTLTAVGTLAFGYCPSLTKVTSLAHTPPSVGNYVFDSTIENSGLKLVVPKGRLSAYQAADTWKDFPNIVETYYDFFQDGIYYNITGPNTVEVTCETEDGGSYSGAVNIPETVNYGGKTYTVTAIGARAFEYCYNLVAVHIPATVTEIKHMAFYDDYNLTSVNLPEHLTEIGIYAFYYCSRLGNIEIPASVTRLNIYAFCGCSGFTEMVVPDAVTTMGYGTFYGCTNLTKVTLGSSLNNIGEDAFRNCTALTTVIVRASIPPTISSNTFMSSTYGDAVLHVPYGSHEAYRNSTYWGQFVNIVSEDVVNPVMAGDVNGDGKLNITDVTALINYLLSHNDSAINPDAADVNQDNSVNISDVTALINMLLSGAGGETTPGIGKTNYIINSVPFTMVKVDGGTFMMGLEGIFTPVHQVTLSDYYIGETEVTQALWQTVMGSNPSSNKSDVNLPVENMTWDACQTFATKLSQLTGQNFHLPSEAQWEFAARGGNKSMGYTYAGSNNLNEVAWYEANSGNKTHIVGTKKANELGLYDMSGNVFEWIQDYYGSYTSDPQVDPQGPTTGEYRVCRSAGYNRPGTSDWFKCAGRTYDSPSTNAYDTGLRLACDVE